MVSTLGGLVFGYELAIISGALLQLKVDFRLSCIQQEALVSSLLFGALLASIVGGCLIDHHGRRKSILLSNILILTGSLVLLISSFTALVVGRLIVGFAMCISSMSCCIFVSEMVVPARRGFLVTLYETGITVGILAAYAVNYILSDLRRGWKWMFGLVVVPTLIQLLFICLIPSSSEESSHQREAADESKFSCDSENRRVHYSNMYFFQRKDNMRSRTIIGLGLVLFQQFTGQPNILSYASTIFYSVGFKSGTLALLASLGLGFVKVGATLTATVFADRVGRRPLLISGCCMMALCLISIGLLSRHSTMNAKRPCDSEDFHMNRSEILHVAVGVQSSETGNENRTLLNNVTWALDAVRDDTPLVSPDMQSSAINWIILICMMAVVSAYSVGFGPSLWIFSNLFLLFNRTYLQMAGCPHFTVIKSFVLLLSTI